MLTQMSLYKVNGQQICPLLHRHFRFLWYEVGYQHVKALWVATTSPCFTSPTPPNPNCDILQRTDHNTGNSMPYSLQIVCGFFYVPESTLSTPKGFETGPMVYYPELRRLESLTICRCHYKGSTFSSVI